MAGIEAGNVFCPEQLLQRCLGKIDFAQRVLDLFLSKVDRDIEALLDAGQQGNCAQLTQSAHRLKGSAASIAAPRLQKLMSELEKAGRQDAHSDVEQLLSQVQSETQSLKKVLARWRTAAAPVTSPVGSSSRLPSKQEWSNAVL